MAVTDRYTHHVLTFLETITKSSKVTLQNLVRASLVRMRIILRQEQFDTFSFEVMHSTAGVRSDLFRRGLNETLLTDFFGGVSSVELVETVGGTGSVESSRVPRAVGSGRDRRVVRTETGAPSTRRGGALLLGALGAVQLVVTLW